MSSTRRKSTRSTNATNIHGKQDFENSLRRQALAARPSVVVVQHAVLPGPLYERVWDIYGEYGAKSMGLDQRNDDGGHAAGGRSQRRRPRAATAQAGDAGGTDGAGGDMLTEALAASAAAKAHNELREWEQQGHRCLDILEPLVVGNVMLPKQAQEVLMAMVLNAERHPGTLSGRAFALLERLLDTHPPCKLEGSTIAENQELWQPVSCTWSAPQHKDAPRLAGLRQAGGLASLVASAHNLVVRLAGAAHRTHLPEAPEAPPEGDIGNALLLKYWVKILKADLDVRLGALRSSGWSPQWQGQLENSLAVRLMTTMTNWADGTASKPGIVKQLATTVVCGHMAQIRGVQLVPAAATGAGAGGGTHAGQLLCGPAEVGHVAATMLNVLYDAFGALNRMRAYRRQGSIGRDNDLVRTDMAVAQIVGKGIPLREPDLLLVLLQALRPATRVRLLVYMLADAAGKRSEHFGRLPDGLEAVYEYYRDKGADEPPQFWASDALEYLLAEDPNQRHAGNSNWNWAAQSFRFHGFPPRVGLALLVTTLTSAALEQAGAEQRELRQAAGGGGAVGEGGEGHEQQQEEGQDGALGPKAWALEAERVAQLYNKAAERLTAEGTVGGAEGEPAAVLVARRCAERLAAGVIEAVDMMVA